MRYFIAVATFCFYTACVIFAMYVSFEELKKYDRNEDLTSVAIRGFEKAQSNQYPDLTICFSANSTTFFNKSALSNNIDSETMVKVIKGRPEKLDNKKIEIGSKILLNLSQEQQETYQNLLANSFHNVFKYWGFTSSNYFGNNYRKTQSGWVDNFTTNWLSATTPCMTSKIQYVDHDIILDETVVLRTENMKSFRYFYLFVHHPNQLIRRIGWSKLNAAAFRGKIRQNYDPRINFVQMSITNVRKIAHRNKPAEPCNGDLIDDDGRWIEQVYKEVGCLPIF